MTIVILRKNIEYLEADIFFITNRWTKNSIMVYGNCFRIYL